MTALLLPSETASPSTQAMRSLAWIVVALTIVFLLNNYLVIWQGWPGVLSNGGAGESGQSFLALLQYASYGLAILAPIGFVIASKSRNLRIDAASITAINAYFVRACFWIVFLVGLADMVISFLRVEELLEGLVGAELTTELGRSRFRGPYVHGPLIILSLIIAAINRSLGFTWLAALVVVAEIQIVLARFVFHYEQAFMGDLVRFWYGALFLFASAHTLLEDGHVRVDVFYAGLRPKTKGLINMIGALILGISLSVVVLAVGMWDKTSIINAPLIAIEVSQSGFGMYVKYLMAGFLAVFAISMMFQFAAAMLDGFADYLDDPDPAGSSAPSMGH